MATSNYEMIIANLPIGFSKIENIKIFLTTSGFLVLKFQKLGKEQLESND